MATVAASKKTANDFFMEVMENGDDEVDILAEAAVELGADDLAKLKKRLENKRARDAKKGKGKEVLTTETLSEGGALVDATKEVVKEIRNIVQEMKDVVEFWKSIESLDTSELITPDVVSAFQYIGFNPDVIMREILFRGKKAGKDHAAILGDMVDIVTIAVIKGSITSDNLKKISDPGKVLYKRLQDTYQLETGGAKGKDSTHLTVARVAAAVPGMVIQVLVKRSEFAKTFVGPFGSKTLPAYLRHQAAAACLPGTLTPKLKDYIIGLITAFTADQTKALSKSKKDTAEELFDTQLNYVVTTNSSAYPSEAQRASIFKSFSLSNDYQKLADVATKIKKVKSDFVTLTQAELDAELAK